jgi:ABC-2 type transport system permease protein
VSGLLRSARRIRALVVRELRATFRDRFTVTILIAVPIAALLLFGFILTTEVKHLDLALLDASDTSASRRIVAELSAQDTFTPHVVRSRTELEQLVGAGRIAAGVVIPPEFARDLERFRSGGPPPEIEVVYDAAETVLAQNAEAYLRALVAATARELVAPGIPGRQAGVAVATRTLFNPTLDGTAYMVSGVFGFVLSFLAVLITAVSVVGERATGTFEQLQVTPATSIEIVLGKLIPLGGVFAFDVALMALIAGFGMGVWPRGSLVFFLVVSAVYVLISLALGLLISATSKSAAEAVQRSVLFSIPLVQLSGFIFPVRNMPTWLQWFPKVFPATHYISVSRAIYLRGEGPLTLWPELAFIALGGVVLVGFAVRSVGARA